VASTTLFVIDDHPVVREGLKMLLEQAGDIRVVGSAATATAALAVLTERSPDVVLLDLDLGDEDGLDALPRIHAAVPGAKVLILTALRIARATRRRSGPAPAGSSSGRSADALLEAIRAVAAGGSGSTARAPGAGPTRRRARAIGALEAHRAWRGSSRSSARG
jgi:DNA-binding NarL/FixJ family response regulator